MLPTRRTAGSPGVKHVHAGEVDRVDDNIQMAELDYAPEENAYEVDHVANYTGGPRNRVDKLTGTS